MSANTIIRCQLVPKLIPDDNECRLYVKARLVCVIYVGEIGANWNTFIISRPRAHDNRVRDSKQSFNLGRIYVIVYGAK